MITSKEDYLNNINNYCMDGEIWKDIKEWKGFYQVSNYGRVRSLDVVKELTSPKGLIYKKINKGRILKLKYIRGYCNVTFRNKNIGKKTLTLHRIVLKTFNPCSDMDNLTIDHIEGNKHDNRIDKLEWVTNKENISRAYKLGLIPKKEQDGELNHMSKLNKQQVIEICENKNNLKAKELGELYNIDRRHVEMIWNRRLWKTVTSDIKYINRVIEEPIKEEIVIYIFTNPLNLNNFEISSQTNIPVHTIVNIHRKVCYSDITDKYKLNKIRGKIYKFYKFFNEDRIYYVSDIHRFYRNITKGKLGITSLDELANKIESNIKGWTCEEITKEEYISYLKKQYGEYKNNTKGDSPCHT